MAVALRGRRQVGKSRLVQEFCDRAAVPYVYYAATKGASPSEASTRAGKPALYHVADSNLRLYLAALRAAQEQARRGRPEPGTHWWSGVGPADGGGRSNR